MCTGKSHRCDIQKMESALVVWNSHVCVRYMTRVVMAGPWTWAASMTWQFVKESSRKASNLGLEPAVTMVKMWDTKYDNF
jgi:hypothetical protein